MEIKTKKIKREEGPNWNKKWGIWKHLSAEISFEKSEIIQGQTTYECRILGSKIGVWHLPWKFLCSKLFFLNQYFVLRHINFSLWSCTLEQLLA